MEHITKGLRYSQLPFSGWKPINGKLLQGRFKCTTEKMLQQFIYIYIYIAQVTRNRHKPVTKIFQQYAKYHNSKVFSTIQYSIASICIMWHRGAVVWVMEGPGILLLKWLHPEARSWTSTSSEWR